MKFYAAALPVLGAAAAASEYAIVPTGSVNQQGMYPYLLGGGSKNVQVSEEACIAQCESMAECLFGTYVTQGSAIDTSTHAYSHHVRAGECWLAAQTHSEPVACGVACKGFKKVQKAFDCKLTPESMNGAAFPKGCPGAVFSNSLPAQRYCDGDHKVAGDQGFPWFAACCKWDANKCITRDPPPPPPNTDQVNECTCDPASPPETYMHCMSLCKGHGLFTYKRHSCDCDPAVHPSVFTQCRQDPFSYTLRVKHLVPRFHTVAIKGGEQHKCKMTAPRECKCCDCRDAGTFYEIREIGFGVHTATAPFLSEMTPVVADINACMELCNANPLCRAGTFITGGEDEGKCYISEHIESSATCQKPCDSFIRVREGDAAQPTTAAPGVNCVCGAVYSPVLCHSTGQTYSNQCQANCARATQCASQITV